MGPRALRRVGFSFVALIFPLAAFEPGADVHVTIIAVPSAGSNITKTLGPLDLRAIQ